jgi:hypothetical protein
VVDDLPVGIGPAAVDHVTARNALCTWIHVRHVVPVQRPELHRKSYADVWYAKKIWTVHGEIGRLTGRIGSVRTLSLSGTSSREAVAKFQPLILFKGSALCIAMWSVVSLLISYCGSSLLA